MRRATLAAAITATAALRDRSGVDGRHGREEARAQRDRAAGRRDGHRPARPDPARHRRQHARGGAAHEPARARRARAHRSGRPGRGRDRLRGRGDRVRHRPQDVQRRRRRGRAGQAGADAARGRAAPGEGDGPGHHVPGHGRDARRLRGARQGPGAAERDRPAVPRELQAGRDPRRRRGLLVPGGQPGRAARPPADRPDRGEQGRPREPRRPRQAARLPLRQRSRRPQERARPQAAGPVRQRGDVRAPRGGQGRPLRPASSRCPRWRPRRSTSCRRIATASSC